MLELVANGEQQTEVRYVWLRVGRCHLRHAMRKCGRKLARYLLHDEPVFENECFVCQAVDFVKCGLIRQAVMFDAV